MRAKLKRLKCVCVWNKIYCASDARREAALNELLQLHLDQSTKRKGDALASGVFSLPFLLLAISQLQGDFKRFSAKMQHSIPAWRTKASNAFIEEPRQIILWCVAPSKQCERSAMNYGTVDKFIISLAASKKSEKRPWQPLECVLLGRKKTINQINKISKKPHTKAFSFIRFIPANEITHTTYIQLRGDENFSTVFNSMMCESECLSRHI